jgi:uncharacterized membrane protein
LGADFYSSTAKDVSADGKLIVGSDSSSSHSHATAFVWTPENGMRALYDELRELGADLTGWDYLEDASAISDNGRWIVGLGRFNGSLSSFVVDRGTASVPESLPLPVPVTTLLALIVASRWLLGR